MSKHEKIDYLEFPASNMDDTKAFFGQVFGWKFQDYGPDYIAVTGAGIDCGFYKSDLTMSTQNGSTLVVFYSEDLEKTQKKIDQFGGKVIVPIFSFPGGRRFHFEDLNGNEFSVWSDK